MSWSKKTAAAAAMVFCIAAGSARADRIEAAIRHDFPGWKIHQHVRGSLNGDIDDDAAAILSRPAEGGDKNGQALLVVYLDDGHGGYKLHTKARKAICVGCGGPKAAMGEPLGEIEISRGLLHITYEGGSREVFTDELKWRLDATKNKFLLIGETRRVTDTVGEDPEVTLDINYVSLKAEKLTGKHKTTCAIARKFRALELSAYDYDGRHVEDIEALSEACGKS
jgi:hypothetical protein